MESAKEMLLTQIEQQVANKDWTIDRHILNSYLKRIGVNESQNIV